MAPILPIFPVVLSGGSGTRLWPLSRKNFPKPFVPLIDNKSLLQLTLERVSPFNTPVTCVISEEHRFLTTDILERVGKIGTLILEPIGRNTAPAMALAALKAHSDGQGNALLLFCPVDHHIPDTQSFIQTVYKALPYAKMDLLVTFGITPTFPSASYGYMQQGPSLDKASWHVDHFIEKPDSETARKLLLSGSVFWNTGIFLATPSTLLKALQTHAPDILHACEKAMSAAHYEVLLNTYACIRPEASAFKKCPSESIDYAVMEHASNVCVVPFNGQWSDVGSWNAIADMTPPSEAGNRLVGHAMSYSSENTHIHAPHRPVAALGTQDLIIVDTQDAVLVAHKDKIEHVKDVVAHLIENHCPQALTHRRVPRPWGWYDSIDLGERFQVKRIVVKQGATLSLQKHTHRSEHWIVVKGTAEVTRGTEVFLLSENESTYIPVDVIHRLRNFGTVDLEMIEVQSGSYLGEDDIIRFEDFYGRVLKAKA